jgi:uncharacterized membrane protein
MSKPTRWLHAEIERWVAEKIISPDQAIRLRELYPAREAALPWGMILFSGLGAVLLGLGAILLFAYNWQGIPKLGKLAVIFGSLLGAQAGALALLERPDWRRQLGEALAVLGTMLFGAGIWLIAQVYNIHEHFPNGFLIWGIGALALGWAMRSAPQGILAAVVLCIWNGTEVAAFDQPLAWGPLLLAGGVGGLAWRTRSKLLLALAVVGLYVMLAMNATSAVENLAFGTLLALATALVGASLWARHSRPWPESAPVLMTLGYAGFLIVLYVLSFAHDAGDWMNWTRHAVARPSLVIYGWMPFGLALLVWAGWFGRWPTRPAPERGPLQPEWLLVPGTLLAAQVFGFSEAARVGGSLVAPLVFNLVLLALAGVWMARGCRLGKLAPLSSGSAVLVLLALGRYFDLFESLLARSVVFLVVGGVLFAQGFFYRRTRKQQAGQEAQP